MSGMTLSLYDGKRQHSAAPLIVLQAANLIFAASCVFLWAMLSLVVGEPIRWAPEYGIGSRPQLFDYPFVLLWLLPVISACAAWVAQQIDRMKLAYFLALYPLAYISLIVGWYYLAPRHWI